MNFSFFFGLRSSAAFGLSVASNVACKAFSGDSLLTMNNGSVVPCASTRCSAVAEVSYINWRQ